MKFYFFLITGNKISGTNQSPVGKASEYTHANYLSANIFYRITGGVISHVMCEASNVDAAIETVEMFLKTQ